MAALEMHEVIELCATAQSREALGHCARDAGRYWARGRRWSWLETVPLSVRQCEVDAVSGDAYLCVLALRAGVALPHDSTCTACVDRENRRAWMRSEAL